jgi:hypothetical protein
MQMASEIPVALMVGGGVDSAAILARWLVDPSSRNFDLDNAIGITAIVGEEFTETKRLIETHLLPLMQGKFRYAQVARGGQSADAGYIVLMRSAAVVSMAVVRASWRWAGRYFAPRRHW